MLRKFIRIVSLTALLHPVSAPDVQSDPYKKVFPRVVNSNKFSNTSEFLDAAISSVNSFNSLIKKENYRTRVSSLNNPTSSDMGFSLEHEVQLALKPLLAKARNTNSDKFAQVVSSLLNSNNTTGLKNSFSVQNPAFPTLLSLVGNLVVHEKKITRQDLDSFVATTSKYFVQYERLNQANLLFDQNIDRLTSRLKDLQFDVREYMLDMIQVLYPMVQRHQVKELGTEELLLNYLDKSKVQAQVSKLKSPPIYPSDGIKTAKEISSTLQKLFTEYQKIYSENYLQIRTILSDSKALGKTINAKQVDASLKELEDLYNESKTSDLLGLRLNTLSQRLKVLVESEQLGSGQ